jgi:hypothetical protein
MKVFVSHNHKDKEIVRKLADDLRRQGVEVWLDEELIAPGEPWAEKLGYAVEQSDAVLVVMSRNTSDSQWQTSEIAFAVAAQKRDISKRIIPILIDKNAEVPFFLKHLLYCDLSDSEAYHRNLPQLIMTIFRKPDDSLKAEQMQRLQIESLRAQKVLLTEKQMAFSHRTAIWTTSILSVVLSMVAASLTIFTGLLGSIQLRSGPENFIIGAAVGFCASLLAGLVTWAFYKKAKRLRRTDG